ncbi:MAG TPA: hypothetical protein PLZ21_02815 [Armatimonadota bacterium]|nr:hypothetical protein [Armatimonadota bacterium]
MISRLTVTLLVLIVLAVPALAQKQEIGSVVIERFQTFEMTDDTVIVSGPRVYVRTKDGKFEAKAARITIRFDPSSVKGGVNALKSASLEGDVWLLTKPEPGRSSEARSERADVDWAGAKQAVLKGNVEVKTVDPTKFQGPLTLVADKATISLKPYGELKNGESRIKIESDPEKSRLEFTPLPAETSEKDSSANQD